MAKKVKEDKVPYIPPVAPDWRVRDGHVPTRSFEVGEFVKFGCHRKTQVTHVLGDGVYQVHCWSTKTNYGRPEEVENDYQCNWYQLQKLNSHIAPVTMLQPEQFFMDHQRRDIMGVLSTVLAEHAGVDFTPDYQRDYVWSLEDKQRLINSIFNNVTIGMVVLAKVPFKENAKGYEVIDGKQRLTALVEFFEDRFTYNGYYFSQLTGRDQTHFENYPISVGVMREPSEKEKYAAFLAVNTFGRVMDESHLVSVREKFNAM